MGRLHVLRGQRCSAAASHAKASYIAGLPITPGPAAATLPSPPTHRLLADDVNSVPWHLAIFDEAHKLKNDRTKLYEAVAGLPTRLRYGLTGTPMQNDYQELWWGGGVGWRVRHFRAYHKSGGGVLRT